MPDKYFVCSNAKIREIYQIKNQQIRETYFDIINVESRNNRGFLHQHPT